MNVLARRQYCNVLNIQVCIWSVFALAHIIISCVLDAIAIHCQYRQVCNTCQHICGMFMVLWYVFCYVFRVRSPCGTDVSPSRLTSRGRVAFRVGLLDSASPACRIRELKASVWLAPPLPRMDVLGPCRSRSFPTLARHMRCFR